MSFADHIFCYLGGVAANIPWLFRQSFIPCRGSTHDLEKFHTFPVGSGIRESFKLVGGVVKINRSQDARKY
jgi:hypothetical protein